MRLGLSVLLLLLGCSGSPMVSTDSGADSGDTPGPPPAARHGHAASYFGTTGTMVLFGGTDMSVVLEDTWMWNGKRWTEVAPATSPPGRFYHAMAYDDARDQIVLFGGHASVTAMAAGQPTPTAMSDTWTWDGSTWTRATPTRVPFARVGAKMAYDADHEVIVMFGGHGANGVPYTDTWLWNGTTWLLASPATSPSARSHHGMVWDPERHRIVLFGGFIGSLAETSSETWTWDGTTWSLATPATSSPKRTSAGMAFDGTNTIVFGGWKADGAELADTWAWNGTTWMQPPSAMPEPSSRILMSFAYDPSRKVATMFGGITQPTDTLFQETWEWNGTMWSGR